MRTSKAVRPHLRLGMGLSLTMALSLAACGDDGGGGGSGDAGEDETIGVSLITKNSTNPFFVTMQEGATEEAKSKNIDLTLAAGKADGDETTQIQAIEEAVVRGDAGILITPNGPGVNPARAAGHRRHHLRNGQLQGRRTDRAVDGWEARRREGDHCPPRHLQ